VGSCREKFRDTGSVETSFGKTEGGTKTSSTGTDNNRIVLMVLYILSIVAIELRGAKTYDDRVLVAEERRRFFGAKRRVCDDAGCKTMG
jgi:hypothetical protein